MDRVGEDVLGLVASHLGAEDTCREMVRVSKRWRSSLINSTRLWYEFAAAASLIGTGPYHPLVDQSSNSPPWRCTPGPQFAHGLSSASASDDFDAEQGLACWYELWRRYSLADEEHRLSVLPFFRSSRRLDDTIYAYQSRLNPVNEVAGPMTLWILTWVQLAILAITLEYNGASFYTFPAQVAFGVCFLWWLANAVPSLARCLHRHHYLGHPRFYEHVSPPNSVGANAWPRDVSYSFHITDNSGLLRRLEAMVLICLTITLINPQDVSGLWWMCTPAAVGFFWLAKTQKEPTEECPISRASVGYLAAASGTIALALVSRWGTVVPLFAPFCIASASIWLEMTIHWSGFDPCACCWICCFLCHHLPQSQWFRRILKGTGLITLWLSGITTIVRADLELFNAHKAQIFWPQSLSWPVIFLPLAWNLALLCPYPPTS